MSEENKAIGRRMVEEVWNKGNLELIDELFAADFVYHDPSFPSFTTREDYQQHVMESRTAYPDLRITIEDVIAEGDKVATRFTVSGTHKEWRTGGQRGTPGTGKRVTFSAMAISRLSGGKVAEMWVNQDALGNMQQIGAIPPLGEGD